MSRNITRAARPQIWHPRCTTGPPRNTIISILAAIAVPLYANIMARARIAKAQADTRSIASAVAIYSAHCGGLPSAAAPQVCPTTAGVLNADLPPPLLLVQTNAQNQIGGPFLNSLT